MPHGSPIIENENEILNYRTLDLLLPGEEGTIQRITDMKKSLEYANKINLKIGDIIKVIDEDKSNKLIRFEKDGQKLDIDQEVAKKIYIK